MDGVSFHGVDNGFRYIMVATVLRNIFCGVMKSNRQPPYGMPLCAFGFSPELKKCPPACFLNGLSNPIIHLIPEKNQGEKPWFLFLAKVI